MKKIIIILSAILLNCATGLAGGSSNVKVDSVANRLWKIQKEFDAFKAEFEPLQSRVASLEKGKADIEKPIVLNLTLTDLLFLALGVIILALLIFIAVDKRKRRGEIIYAITGNKKGDYDIRVKLWENEIIAKALAAIKQNHPSDATQKLYDSELINLQNRVGVLENSDRPESAQDSIHKSAPQEQKQEPVQPPCDQPKTLYADVIIRNFFNKVSELPNDDTVYELLLKTPSDTTAEFTIFQNAYPRVIDTPDFIKGCDKQGGGKNSLEVESGVVTLQNNGKWQITQPAKVKFV